MNRLALRKRRKKKKRKEKLSETWVIRMAFEWDSQSQRRDPFVNLTHAHIVISRETGVTVQCYRDRLGLVWNISVVFSRPCDHFSEVCVWPIYETKLSAILGSNVHWLRNEVEELSLTRTYEFLSPGAAIWFIFTHRSVLSFPFVAKGKKELVSAPKNLYADWRGRPTTQTFHRFEVQAYRFWKLCQNWLCVPAWVWC